MELKELSELSDVEERLDFIFSESRRVEAFAPRDAVTPQECVVIEKLSRVRSHNLIKEKTSHINLDPGEAVLAHETNPGWADSILQEGFKDPFERGAEESYHIPESKRYGKVFLWPHTAEIGTHDRSGSIILCICDISDVSISTYSSFSTLESPEFYKKMSYTYDKIRPSEYNQNHVFSYRDYIQWLRSNRGIESRARYENLLPYCLTNNTS